MKKLLMFMFLSVIPLYSMADAVEIDGIYYNLFSLLKRAEVTSNPNKYSGEVVIPEKVTYNEVEYSVTSIGSGSFNGCSGLTAITIPEGVTIIDAYAFTNCSGLTTLVIPNNVTTIGFHAFWGCSGLTSITIPNNVTKIGDSAFNGCSGLTSITIPNSVSSIGDCAFKECCLTSIVVDKGNETYDSREGCNAIIKTKTNTLIQGCKNTVVPNSVTSIGVGAFWGCCDLTTITIPNSVTSIGEGAFWGCCDLTAITIPKNVTSIGNSAFRECRGLTAITIPKGVTSISEGAFYGCSGLTAITIPEGVTSIGKDAFSGCSYMHTVTLPEGVTSIGIQAFWQCTNLSSIDIPESVTTIGSAAFQNCRSLSSVNIPKDINSIDAYIFSGCSALSSITIPEGVTSINEHAFSNCNGLTSIKIPNSVESIGKNAFQGCDRVNSLTIGENVKTIDESAFRFCYNLTSLIIPNSVTRIGSNAFWQCNKITSISLGNNLQIIGSNAFKYCSQINELIIPNSVTTLSANAFENCSALTSVYIGENVNSIASGVFTGCGKITKVTSGIKEPMNIGSNVFDSNVYTNAELIVPTGCLSKYQTCDGWKEFVNMKDTGGGISYNDKLSINSVTGFTGKQVVFPVSLVNENEIAGVQFKLSLPAGVSVALNSKNKLMFSKTERDADHTLSGSKAEDGTYTVLLYSADTEAITGNEGSIIDVTLDIDKEMKDGMYEIKLSDIVLSTTKAVKINTSDVTVQLEVKSYLLGDPNNDGSIDVVDITMIANHILGNNPENFIFAAADVDADGTVDVNDIISIANIILYGSSSNAKPSMAKASSHLANNVTSNESNGDGFTVKNVSVEKGGTVKVDFELTNAAHDFSGIQFDIDLGDGLSFATKSNGKVNVTRGARLEDEDFTLSVAKQEGNQYRALGYYTDGSVIPEKSGTLFTLTLVADESLTDGKTFNCQLDNITLSTKNNEKIQQETQTFTVTIGDATGISDLLNEDGTPAVMYDLTGKRIETPAKSGQVIIIKKGGKVVKVFKK